MSSSDSSSDSDSEEVQQTVAKTEEADDSSSDSSDDEETPAPKAAAKAADSDDSDSSSDEEEEEKPAKTEKVMSSDSSDSDDSDSEDKPEPAKKKAAEPAKEDSDSSDSDSSDDEEEVKAPAKAAAAADSDSDSDSSDEEEEEKKEVKAETKDDSSDSSDDEAEESKAEEMEVEEAEEEFTPVKSKSSVTILFQWDLKKGDANPRKRKLSTPSEPSKKAKKSPAAEKSAAAASEKPASTASASAKSVTIEKEYNPDDFRSAELKDQTDTIFVKGIDVNAYEKDIKEFFTEKVAAPVSIRHKWEESRPGLAWVTFATNEQASKAVIDCNGEYIKDRYVFTDWAKPRQNNGGGKRSSGPRNAHLKDTTNRVWVGNVHREVDQESLSDFFKETGVPTDVYILAGDGSRPQIAFVSFESNEIATKAVENLQGEYLMGNGLRLDWAEPRRDSGNGGGRKRKQELSEKPEGCVTCFVGRLADTVDDDKLEELFKEAGTIESIRYMERDGEFKGVAFVQFSETESTDKAVQKNGTSFLGKTIRVDYAADRKKPAY